MIVTTTTRYILDELDLELAHQHPADIVSIERKYPDHYDVPFNFPWMEPKQRLELAKALLATLLPASPEIDVVPVTTLSFEGIAQDGFTLEIYKGGSINLEFEEPYDDSTTHGTWLKADQAQAIANAIIRARSDPCPST